MCCYTNHKNHYIQMSVCDYRRMETFVLCIVILFNIRCASRLPEMDHVLNDDRSVSLLCNVIKIWKTSVNYKDSLS
jgi:hypothetical protein